MLTLRVVEGIPAELANQQARPGRSCCVSTSFVARKPESFCVVNQAGKDLCSAVMGLFVPLLLSCAAPSNSACASPTLSAMAVQLITHLAKGTGRSTDTFKVMPTSAYPPALLPLEFK
jgi:hypothetical protein